MKKLDIIAAVILLALSAIVTVQTWDLPYWTMFAPGPSFASFWIAGSGALIGVALLIQALRSSDRPADWLDRTGARQVFLGAAALWLLLFMLPWLGTTISSMIFMLLFLLGIARRPIVPSLFTSVLTVGLVQAVFGMWLNIDLPTGIVGF